MDRSVIADPVDGIRHAPSDVLIQFASTSLISQLGEYLQGLDHEDKLQAIRACMIIWVVTKGCIIPRKFQLEASLAMLHQRDSIIIASTGSGKTLCLLIPLLLCPKSISITISPLKHLQSTQVLESERYRINTIAINEDTPNDKTLWKNIRDGHYQHIIASPEQLGPYNGHLPRLARLLRENRSFVNKIAHIHIDEAHNIHTAGLPHYGEIAFRPAYSKIGLLCPLLLKGLPIQVLSATLPDHILATVKNQLALSPNLLEIRLSVNRPNITYATIPIVGTLRNFDNFSLLMPSAFHPPMTLPKTLVFHDSKQDATDAATFMDSRLPKSLQNQGIVKHYHSDMSLQYLQQTFEDFSRPDGTCRVLHATTGAATGLDLQGIRIVIQYGLCKNMAELAQRAGRAARDPNLHGLFLLMVEPFALDLPQDTLKRADPDEPYTVDFKKNPSKQDRTSVASIQYAQSKTCLREFFARYLGDTSSQDFTGLWCCDRHHDTDFNLTTFFHGNPWTSGMSSADNDSESTSKPNKRKRNHLRPASERQELFDLLTDWRGQTLELNPFFPASWILSDGHLELISRTPMSRIPTLQDLIALLEETDDWANEYGGKVFEKISQYEQSLKTRSASDPSDSHSQPSSTIRAAKRSKGIRFTMVQTPESFSAAM